MYLIFFINRLLNQFNLTWTSLGLNYTHKLKYGEVTFHVPASFEQVLHFLGINKEYNILDFKTSKDYFTFLLESSYLNKNCFNIELSTKDNTLNTLYEEFKYYLTLDTSIKYKVLPDNIILSIDTYFKTNLEKKIKLLDTTNYIPNKSKFNGKLVLKWIPELKPGKALGDFINEFKQDIENKKQISFDEYVRSHSYNAIKSNIINYYYNLFVFDLDKLTIHLPY